MFDIVDHMEREDEKLGKAKIRVIGVGGGGCNAVNTMIREGLKGVEYIVANTDAQALKASLSKTKLQLGGEITKGLGAGANPEVGRKAALEEYENLSKVLEGADMVFITAGMGGGTGTGAAPVIAKLAKEMGALTVGVVTRPFLFEGKKRYRQAEEGIRLLEETVDSLITIPNQKLLYLAGESLSLVETFKKADEVLLHAVQGISDLINNTGLINADFADVSTVMANKGLALMGTGVCSGPERAIKAATEAISSPLLEDISIDGATGIIINITGNSSLTTHETNEAVSLIMEAADEDAEIIFGTVIDDNMGEYLKVTVIATGLGGKTRAAARLNSASTGRNTSTSSHASTAMSSAAAPVCAAPRVEAQPQTVAAPQYQAPTPAPAQPAAPVSAPRYAAPPQAPIARPVQPQQQQQRYVAPTAPSETAHYEENWNARAQQRPLPEQSPAAHGVNPFVANEAQMTPLMKNIHKAASDYRGKQDTGSMADFQVEFASEKLSDPAKAHTAGGSSIEERLSFINFDEDEFDAPAFLRKERPGVQSDERDAQ